MGFKGKVRMLSKGSAELLKGEPVLKMLQGKAGAVARRAGDGFAADVQVGRTRALASVTASTPEARAAEANDRTLLKALDAAR